MYDGFVRPARVRIAMEIIVGHLEQESFQCRVAERRFQVETISLGYREWDLICTGGYEIYFKRADMIDLFLASTQYRTLVDPR